MEVMEKFYSASIEEAKRGYIEESGLLRCLLCGHTAERGIIYPVGDRLLDAAKYMEQHIVSEHGSVFEYLSGMDKRLTGLSEHQNSMLAMFYKGMSDQEVRQSLNIGSASTVRNHRFALREREKQARVFLVIMELLKRKSRNAVPDIVPHPAATMVDDRYNVTEEKRREVIGKYFPDGVEGKLKTFSMKEKNRIVVLSEIVRRFAAGRIYTEKQVNAILKEINDEEYGTIRRYLIEYGFMDREPDGSGYWVRENG